MYLAVVSSSELYGGAVHFSRYFFCSGSHCEASQEDRIDVFCSFEFSVNSQIKVAFPAGLYYNKDKVFTSFLCLEVKL